MTAIQQRIRLHLASTLSLKQRQVMVEARPYLIQGQPKLSYIPPGGDYGEVIHPKYCALFPCQPCDKLVTIDTADKVKCPKPIINVIVNVYMCQVKKCYFNFIITYIITSGNFG